LLDIDKVLEFSGTRLKNEAPKSAAQPASAVTAPIAAASK